MTRAERLAGQMPTDADIEAIARETLRRLPPPFSASLGDIVLRIEPIAESDTASSVGLDDPMQLIGLYQGVPLDQQSVSDPVRMPEQISLYSGPILAEWRRSGISLAELVSHIVIHEIGHHFGFSDDDMHTLEDSAE